MTPDQLAEIHTISEAPSTHRSAAAAAAAAPKRDDAAAAAKAAATQIDAVNKKVAGVESALTLVVQELRQQRDELKDTLAQTLASTQKKEKKEPALPVVERLLLPPDVRKWRAAHVLAWVVFDLGACYPLPSPYLTPF